MKRKFLSVKISGLVITKTELFYEGSITIDSKIIKSAGIKPYEWVHVLNLNNGERLETYVIEGEEGSGIVCLNGPAARRGFAGDNIIVITTVYLEPDEIKSHIIRKVSVSNNNRTIEVKEEKL